MGPVGWKTRVRVGRERSFGPIAAGQKMTVQATMVRSDVWYYYWWWLSFDDWLIDYWWLKTMSMLVPWRRRGVSQQLHSDLGDKMPLPGGIIMILTRGWAKPETKNWYRFKNFLIYVRLPLFEYCSIGPSLLSLSVLKSVYMTKENCFPFQNIPHYLKYTFRK